MGRWGEVAELLASRGFRVLRNRWGVLPDGAVDYGATRFLFIAVGAVRALRLVAPLHSPSPLHPGARGRWRMLNGLLRRAA